MTTPWQEERHQKIRAQLAAFGRVSIDKIVEEFCVSRETVRRDLMEMEAAGELRRVRGGAVPSLREDTTFSTRVKQRLQEKRCIAATALRLLESGTTIFMDAGATSQVMADALAGPNGLTDVTVITNAVDVALLAPWGVNAKMGAMNHFLHGAEIARAMVRNSERRIILADHSKVGLPSRSVFCRTDDMDHLIVDAKARLRPGFDELEEQVSGLIVAE